MKKEEMSKDVGEQLATLREHAQDLTKLCESLGLAVRGDVSFSAIDETKKVLEGFKDAKAACEKAQRTLKARAVARMKEG